MYSRGPESTGLVHFAECCYRATLLAEPEDVSKFLSNHVQQILDSRVDDFADPSDVVFNFEEQWGMSKCYLTYNVNKI